MSDRLGRPCMQNISQALASARATHTGAGSRGWSQQSEDALFEQYFLPERRKGGHDTGIYVELGVRPTRTYLDVLVCVLACELNRLSLNRPTTVRR